MKTNMQSMTTVEMQMKVLRDNFSEVCGIVIKDDHIAVSFYCVHIFGLFLAGGDDFIIYDCDDHPTMDIENNDENLKLFMEAI